MTVHTAPRAFDSSQLEDGFEVLKTSAGWISVRQRTEGHVYTFFFNSARTLVASVQVRPAETARYAPEYFEETAWRYADRLAREGGLILARGSRTQMRLG